MFEVLDLFSGIGGFSLGLEAAGMNTIAFCERDEFCQKVLKKHWPSVPCHKDITELDGKQYAGKVGLVCGGYPCQPFSVAGKRLAHEDERHLWPEMLRIIQGCRPRWVIAENVAGHLKLGFDEVAASLEAEGFTVWSFIIPACAVDAPHRRDRIWILAHAKSQQNRRIQQRELQTDFGSEIIANAESHAQQQGGGRIWPYSNTSTSSDTDEQRFQRCRKEPISGESVLSEQFKRGSTQWANGWDLSAPRLCRVGDGIPNRVAKLRTFGNAIIPQIAEIIGQAIVEYENASQPV